HNALICGFANSACGAELRRTKLSRFRKQRAEDAKREIMATMLLMRRAVIQNLRTFRRPTPRKALKQLRINSPYNAPFQRSITNRSPQSQLQSSMRFARRVSTPIALAGVGAAAYYVYQQQGTPASTADAVPTVTGTALGVSRGYSTGASPQAHATPSNQPADILGSSAVPEAVRRALIVDQGQL
ncbi:hypothetical protein B0A55_13457, partial [Friedmanniomyces simplex]